MSAGLRVGFVGLGNIGKPMALRLAAADGLDLGDKPSGVAGHSP